jgi:peptidoglycan/LPS O-acetylase OafA/YrhL
MRQQRASQRRLQVLLGIGGLLVLLLLLLLSTTAVTTAAAEPATATAAAAAADATATAEENLHDGLDSLDDDDLLTIEDEEEAARLAAAAAASGGERRDGEVRRIGHMWCAMLLSITALVCLVYVWNKHVVGRRHWAALFICYMLAALVAGLRLSTDASRSFDWHVQTQAQAQQLRTLHFVAVWFARVFGAVALALGTALVYHPGYRININAGVQGISYFAAMFCVYMVLFSQNALWQYYVVLPALLSVVLTSVYRRAKFLFAGAMLLVLAAQLPSLLPNNNHIVSAAEEDQDDGNNSRIAFLQTLGLTAVALVQLCTAVALLNLAKASTATMLVVQPTDASDAATTAAAAAKTTTKRVKPRTKKNKKKKY